MSKQWTETNHVSSLLSPVGIFGRKIFFAIPSPLTLYEFKSSTAAPCTQTRMNIVFTRIASIKYNSEIISQQTAGVCIYKLAAV